MKLFLLLALATPLVSRAQFTGNKSDIDWIRNAIVQTGKAINEKNVEGIMKYYSKDIIVSYPGVPDTDYAMFEASYKEMLTPKPGFATKTLPTIQEITVSGDLAVVRMVWETDITDGDKTTHRQAKDLQVWQRDGREWKFTRGMWYRVKSAP